MTRLSTLMLRAKRRKFDDFKGLLVLMSANESHRNKLLKSREVSFDLVSCLTYLMVSFIQVTGESETFTDQWLNDVLRSFRDTFRAHSENYQDLGSFLEDVSPALLDTERLQHALSSLQSRYPGESNAADFKLSFYQLMESIREIVSLSTFYQLLMIDGKESNVEILTEAQVSNFSRQCSSLSYRSRNLKIAESDLSHSFPVVKRYGGD